MDNASKALIIAGSVLIAILLISLGLFIFKTTSGVTDQTQDLDKTLEAQQFNSQFDKYCGDSVKGSQVRLLCEVIIAHNGHSKNTVKIVDKITGTAIDKESATDINNYKNTIKTNKIYTVKPDYSEGLITSIEVSTPTTTT